MALIIKNKQSIDLKTDDAENKAENKRSYSLDDFLKWRNEQQKKQGYSLKSFEEWEAKKNEAETVFKEAEEAMREAALNQTKANSAAKQFVNPETPSNVVEKVRVEAASELLKPNTSVMQRRDVGKSGITLVDEIAKEAAADVAVKEAVRDYGISAGSPNKSVKEEKHANVEKAKQALAETKVARSETSDSINQKLRETIESDPVLNRLVTDYWQKAWEYSQPIGEGQTAAQADALRDAAYEDMMQAREVLTRLGYDADALKDAYAQVANKEETEKIIKDYTEYAKEHPVSATVKSIGLNAAGSLSALSGMLESTIKGEDIDTNSPAYAQLNAANALREGVSEDLSPGAQFAYNTGISMADSLLMMPMGTLGTVVMGANALAQTSKDVLDKGGTKAQAWATGLVAGIAETLLEKVSLDQLKVFAKMPGRGFLAFMKNVGKGMVTEGSEELFTEIVNVIGDALINGGNSDIEQRYNDYVKSGMNKEAAWKQTAADYAKQLGLSFLGGAVSGGVFGAGSQLIGDLAQKIKDIDVGKEVRKMGDAEISAQVEEGLKAEDGTEQKRVAEKLNKKLTENEEYSDADVGAVAIENTRARVEKVETQMAASPELEKEIESADKEAGNSIARTAITDLYVRANRILEGEIDLARSSEELDRTADAVRSNKKLSDSQKNAIIKAVDNVKEWLTETAESRPKQAESATPAATEVTPEVMAEREARAAKATNEIERSGILSGADDKQIKEVMGIADVFRQHGSTLKVRFSADYDVINGTPNGKYDKVTNTIYVNPKAQNPFAQVIAHELVHRMAYNSGNLYNEFLDAVTTFYSSKGISFDQLAKQKVNEYATSGIALDENQSREEVAAAFVEEYVRDRQAIRSLVRKHRSVAEWFRIRLRGLLGWLKPQQTKEARYLQDALDIFSDELRGVGSDGLTPKQRELKAIDDQYASGEITGEEHDRLAAEIEGKYGESYSITKADGYDVVWLDENILKDKPSDVKYTDYIKDVLATSLDDDGTYLNSLPESGAEVYAHKDLPEEFTGSVYTKHLRNRKQDQFRAKMRTATSLGELVQIATDRSWERAIHSENKDAKYGIYKYKSRFAFPKSDSSGKTSGVRAYMCDLVIINASDGKKYLYDIQNIKEDTITAGVLFSRIKRRDSFKSGTQTIQPKGIFSNSISRDVAESNNADESVTKMSQSENNVSYSISADVQAEYERNVDAVLDGTYSSPDPLIVGRTPDVLRLIGFAELPVVITPNHIYSIAKTESEAKADGRYNARTNYHGLGERAVKDIMKSISNPLMVVMAPDAKEGKSGRNSAHRVIVITETMVDGKRVVSPIEINADVVMDNQNYDTNLVASYYAKDSLKKIISEVVAQETIGNTAIYYGDKKRISDFVKGLGFQLPAVFKDIRNSIRTTDFVKDLGFQLPANFKDIRNSDVIIRDIGENVNKGIENVTQSKQFKRWFGDWQNDPASASKVVNKDGTPKVVYHGTNAEFTIFDRTKGTKRVHLNVMGGGNYFTSKKSGAEKYGDRIVEAYLSIKNPYVFDSKQYTTVANQIAEEFGIDRDSFTSNDAQRVLKDRGYDGIILYDVNGEIVIANTFDSNQIKSATENVGTFSATNHDIRYSISKNSKSTEEITREDINELHTIGRKRINELMGAEVRKVEKWARNFYKELGVKSPFFRAWFGDWRAYDKTKINVIPIDNIDVTNAVFTNGDYSVGDTGWTIHAGKTLREETKHYARGEKISVKALSEISNILENAILLDTAVSVPDSNNKSSGTAFMHYLYTPVRYNGRLYIAKTTVEEYYNEATREIARKAYHLKGIKIESADGRFTVNNTATTSRSDTDSVISIAVLCDLVKRNDITYQPYPVNKSLLNKDGTPKLFYHGTTNYEEKSTWNEKTKTYDTEYTEFTVFKKSYPEQVGHFFTDDRDNAGGYGSKVYAVYVSLKKPLVIDCKGNTYDAINYKGEEMDTYEWAEWAKKKGYDGVVFKNISDGADIGDMSQPTTEVVAFYSNQIKSATENVGTFSASNSDIRYSISPAVDENGKQKIAAGMSDEQRYDILKGKSIRVAFYDKDKYEAARPRIKEINVIRFNDAKNLVRKLANEFGAIRVYENEDVELEFEFTNNGLAESLHKQKRNLDDYVKFLTIAEKVIENAKGLECHTDRYSGTPRTDITNIGDYVLVGAFRDEGKIIPVKLLVKQFSDKPNKLYVAITVNKIEAEIVTLAKGNTAKHHPAPSASTSESEIVTLAKGNTAKHHPAPSDSTNESEIFALAKGNAAEHHPTPSDSEYSLTQILENVNPADKTLIKYIPDGFLDDAQLAAKAEAIKEERDYVERKTGVSYSISFDGAIPFTPPKEEEGLNTKELEDVDEEYILDEADAEVAVPYEDEEGNLRFMSLKEAKAAEKRYYDLLNQTGRLEHDLKARKEAIEQGVKILQDKYVSLDKIKEAMDDGSYAPRMIAVHKKLKEYENTLRNAKEAKYTPDIDKYTLIVESTKKYIEAAGRAYRYQIRDGKSLEALGSYHEWKGKEGLLSGLRYATETPTRIIEDIAPNEAAAKRMLAYAFDPVRKNEANRQRWIRDLRARVKALKIGTKKEGKNANTESEAVQLVGEYMHIIDLLGGKRRMYGMDRGEWQKALDDFKAANPDMKWPEVESKAKAMREIYDEIYEELSNVLVTNGYPPVNKRGGYFPHFSENEPDSVLGKAAAAIGLQIQGNELPTSIYGLTANFKPGKSYFGNLNRRTGNNTTYDALRGFEIYINGASNVIHHTDDIQRLRSLARVIRKESADPDTKKKIEELVNARDGLTDEQKDMQINEMLKDAKFKLAGFASWLDEYTNGLANKKSKYDRSMEELLGRTIYSLVGQLESRVAANMVALNPGSWLTNFIPLTQARALIGDKYMLKAAAMAVANAARDDGFTDMSDFLVSRKGSDPVVMVMSDRVSSFLSRPMEWIDGFASQTIVRARYMQNVEKHGMSEEAAMAEANVFAGKVMADRSKGATPTIFNSKNPLIKVFTQFQIEQNNQLRYLLKDIPKETEKAQHAILALMGAMMKFAVGAYLFNDLYEYFIGRRPAFDILGIVNNTFGSAVGYKLPNIIEAIVEVTGDAVKGEMKEPGEYFETKKKGIAPALGEGGTELLENLPFIGGYLGGGRLPIANAIGNPLEVAGEALALIPTVDEETGEVVQNGSWQRLVKTAYDELSKPIYYLAPKFGGGQMKKVLEGTFAVAQHGSYTYNKKGEAQLQYPVLSDNNLQTALNWGAAVIFGKTTTPWAREWIENSFKTRTVGETAAYKAMIEIGEQSSDAYAVLDRVKEAKAEHSRLDKKGNSPYDSGTEAALAMLKADNTLQEISKAQVYKHLLASSDEKEYLYATIRYQDPALYRVLTGMRDVTAGGDVSAKAQKQELILNSDLSDAAKVKVYRVKAASDEDEEFMDRMKQQGVSEITTLKVITKAGAATKNSEKYKAVSTTTMTESQRNAFMKQIMTDSQYSKYNLANSKGITTAVWAQFTARLEAVNASGAASQQEAAKALAGMNITQNQKAAIWQLQNKGWKAENNPFNPKVGALIKEQME